MKDLIIRVACFISIILIIAVSGCVAPPKENATSVIGGNINNPGGQAGNSLTTTPTPNYVSEVTPFVTVTPTSGFHTVPPTQSPGDLYCRIYSTVNTDNTTAIVFNVQNPPMYINYTVKPSNVTIHKVVDTKIQGKGEELLEIDTYSPISTFVIKVMSKSTGEIYLQDGFGTQKYTTYLSRTLKVLNRDNMQIEFSGRNITAKAMVWVKPEGNFIDPSQFNRSTDCAYFAPNPRDAISIATATTTATPTYALQS